MKEHQIGFTSSDGVEYIKVFANDVQKVDDDAVIADGVRIEMSGCIQLFTIIDDDVKQPCEH